MGVPGLLPYVVKKFQHYDRSKKPTTTTTSFDDSASKYILEFLEKAGVKHETDYLELDCNAMIYPPVNLVFHNIGGPIGRYPYSNFTEEQKRNEAFKLFWKDVSFLVDRYKPGTLYLAIDGPAPLAKQNQQRDRRYTALEGVDPKTIDYDSTEPLKFSTTQISPGTVFMMEWIKFINLQIRKYINTTWKDLIIMFSPGSVPGEGEHKIIDFIRGLPEQERKRKHLVVGNDGDLIFLTMATQIPRMYLLRDNTYSPGCKLLIAISKMARGPLSQFFGLKNYKEAVNEFVFVGLFVGNDFLPMVPMFDSLENGLDIMIGKLRSNNFRLVTDDGQINMADFRSFVGMLSKEEPVLFAEQPERFRHWDGPHSEDRKVKGVTKETFRLHLLEKYVRGGRLDFDNFRKAYHKKIGANSPELLKKICYSYVKTLIWAYVYYTKGLPSWEWYYPYHYTPLMCDLLEYIDSITATPNGVKKSGLYDFDFGEPSVPFVQLISILPPSASRNLPPPYRHLMLSAQSPLVEKGFCPHPPYKRDYEWKRRLHAGVVLINHVDVKLVRKCYESVAKRDPNEYARNQFGVFKTFYYNEDMSPYCYESSYGRIRECYVDSIEGDIDFE